jgi:putative tricarboxylic transport membrane protein
MILFGLIGYGFRKIDYEPAPLVLAFVLGPLLEQNLRQALILSDGNLAVFVTHPISAVCLFVSVFLLVSSVIPFIQKKRSVLEEDL